MKIRVILLLAIMGGLQAYNPNLERTFEASMGQNWNAEIRNKAKYTLAITIENGSNIIKSDIKKKAGPDGDENNYTTPYLLLPPAHSSYFTREKDIPVIRIADLDLTQETKITIGRIEVNISGVAEMKDPISWKIAKATSSQVIGMQYDSIFLTYEDGQLRIQQGSGGKTQSGLPIKKNVARADITSIPDGQIRIQLGGIQIGNYRFIFEHLNRAMMKAGYPCLDHFDLGIKSMYVTPGSKCNN